MTNYQLRVYNTSGTLQAVLTDFVSLSYVRVVNGVGALNFALRGDHPILSSLEDKWRIEVRRKPDNGDWRTELTTMFRDEEWTYDENGSHFMAFCPATEAMLNWRIVNWASNTTNRSSFSSAKAETVMKTLVNYNLGSSATTGNGRKRTGTISGITVAADSAGGNTIDWNCHGDNLLETLQKIAKIGGGDFAFVNTTPVAHVFTFYAGQLGDDLTASVTFALELGNMANPTYSVTRTSEKTVASVWGQGTDDNRDYVTRTGSNYSATNDIELYVDARDVEIGNTAKLNSRGDTKVVEFEARKIFNFDVVQTGALSYGVDYDLGDSVTAINPYNDDSLEQKIVSVAVVLEEDGNETINIETETPNS